ncbi:MAG TPA: glycerol-3-phosphate 1-O-acyltransferase PlsY [Thermomicrobiales bacterium]|nr:glycerol-3-phosphate 1-O-acyltransferase PlsY [Thermomicrobiales bacterium]
MDILRSVLLIAITYGLAGIPWGVVLGRLIKGVDLRSYGSGATGATNSLRVLGWQISVAVFILDFGKGFLPVLLARWIDLPGWGIALTAIVSVVGHCWSPYIGFRGGKGMATGGGAAVALLPWLFGLLLFVVAVVYLTRYVSLASILTAIVGPLIVLVLWLLGLFPAWWVVGVIGIGSIILWQHRGNIDRLRKGTERKFGRSESPSGNSA